MNVIAFDHLGAPASSVSTGPRRSPPVERAGALRERRVQAELAQALLFQEQRMAIVAHDLRNPLNTVVMLSSDFSGRSDLPEDVRQGLATVLTAAWRMNELIETLIGFSAARFGGSIPVSPVPTDLREVTRVAVDELRHAMPQRLISVDAVGDTRGTWDPARMVQVVSNLVGNALTHGTGAVDVSVEGRESHALVAVGNEGPVIPAEVLPTLFEPFRRGGPPDQSPRGLGLGLYIAKQIVLAHAGTIAVNSTPERGTVFTVRLPRTGLAIRECGAPRGTRGHDGDVS